MDQETKQKWTAALRSGKYKQGRTSLNNNNEFFCCLGVLCEVVGLKKSQEGRSNCFGYQNTDDDETQFSFNLLPNQLCNLLTNPQRVELMKMNDGFPVDQNTKTFPEIADWIDENL